MYSLTKEGKFFFIIMKKYKIKLNNLKKISQKHNVIL